MPGDRIHTFFGERLTETAYSAIMRGDVEGVLPWALAVAIRTGDRNFVPMVEAFTNAETRRLIRVSAFD